MSLEESDRALCQAVSRIPRPDRDFLINVLCSDDATRAEAIGNLHATGLAAATVELLIDAEAEPALRAVLVRLLREA